MADDKCYAVVEFQKWKSHSEIANKNNHNFRVNPVDVLKPEKAGENEIMLSAEDANTKERWLKLVDIIEDTMKKSRESSPPLNPVKLREQIIQNANKAGYSMDDKTAKEMLSLIAEGVNLKQYYDNQYLRGERTNFVQQFEDRLAKHGIKKVRKNGVMEIGVVMKVTKGFENLPEGFDLEKWKADSMKWLEEKFGKENILSAVYHADEFSPHIQASIIPITEDGRLSAKDFLPDWTAYSEAQDTYYNAVKQDGIYRGVRGGQPGFEDQRRAHNALVNAGEVRLPEPYAGESVKEYKQRAEEAHKQLGMQSHLKIKEAERCHIVEMTELENEADELRDEIKKLRKERDQAKAKTHSLTRENKFYREQLQGGGVTDRELKDSASVAVKVQSEYEDKLKKAEQRVTKMYDKILELQKSNGEMAKKLSLYDKIIVDGGLSQAALNNNMLLNYISYALANGYPRAEETKKEMQAAYNFGRNAQERGKVIDHTDDSI